MTALNTIAHGVWSIDHDFSAPDLRIPLRMTVLQTDDGGLVLYSPVPLEGDLPDRIRELHRGGVRSARSLLRYMATPRAMFSARARAFSGRGPTGRPSASKS